MEQASRLTHKNINTVLGLGKSDGYVYVLHDYDEGRTLGDLIKKKSAARKIFSFKGAFNILTHLCNALEYAHQVLPHGVLSPDEVTVSPQGRVKIVGFGVDYAIDRARRGEPVMPAGLPVGQPSDVVKIAQGLLAGTDARARYAACNALGPMARTAEAALPAPGRRPLRRSRAVRRRRRGRAR